MDAGFLRILADAGEGCGMSRLLTTQDGRRDPTQRILGLCLMTIGTFFVALVMAVTFYGAFL